ncbi:MAG TPA: putative toxin-antitoxin system toxin component, PIN family, partial [Pirellulales bacterium]|nr:putative toxin-antitoxin system toxin component, PIN family [Pirellulales bacterium]
MRTIAVFDTNILLSATGWKGVPYKCVELARAGSVEGVTCRELLDELADKLQVKLLFTPEQSVETLTDLLGFLRVVPITGQMKAVAADPDDDKVLECAVLAGATHVVTGDRRHLLPMGVFQGIYIVTAAEYLASAANP